MRCKNCGWPNKPNETVCVKCGSPLDGEISMTDDSDRYETSSGRIYNNDDGLKKTVMETDAFGPSVDVYPSDSKDTMATVNETTCPKCGYPMRSDAIKCPNCNFSVNGNPDTRPLNVNTNAYQRRPTRMAETPEDVPENASTRKDHKTSSPRSITNEKKFRGTINPYMMNIPQEPTFILQPLQRMNERKPVEAVELELESGEVVLTRDNTEPGNPSITSKAQAVVSYKNGHWYIENCSEQKTTFVLASNEIELHDGDIILLGNRMFEFKEQKEQ